MTTSLVPPFAVISGAQVHRALDGREKQIVELVEATYRLHAAGETVNAASYFLRFPDRPAPRIITRPGSLGGTFQVDDLKWTSSFPGNVALRTPRASAVLIVGNFFHDLRP
jgi:ornithine cyclodeaminase/alanine dehydrogenase-like protein (mu-crystallin family)